MFFVYVSGNNKTIAKGGVKRKRERKRKTGEKKKMVVDERKTELRM